jgi:hypothetical protein
MIPIFLWSTVVIHDQNPVVDAGLRKMVAAGRDAVAVISFPSRLIPSTGQLFVSRLFVSRR